MSEVGGSGVAELIDVCSFPSDNPNSDPSDCIFAKANSGKLEVVKTLVPSTDPGLFNLLIDSVVKVSNIGNNGTTEENVVTAGNHTVSETAGTNTTLSNYSSSVSCRDLNGTGAVIASNANSGSVTVSVADGSDIVCTITNTRVNNASLTIIKDAQPNDGQDFAFTTTGTGLSNFSLDDDADNTLSNTKVFSNLAAGTYSVAESGVAGWDQTSATCTDGSLVSAINLGSGENVTCTFTNTKQPKLTVVKNVINDNGGNLNASNFPLFVNGNSVVSGAVNFYSPGSYTVSETQQSGYVQTSIVCDSGKSNPVSLNAGDDVTCTVTNDDQQSYIIVDKTVVNDNGGTALANDFALKVDGNAVLDAVAYPVNPGTHTASETLLSGYTAGSWGGDCSTGGSVTVALGETKTCTITNDDVAPSLTLVKTVTNDNGGSAVATTWTLSATGPTSISGAGGATSDSTFDAGTYTLSESAGPTGYAAGSWVCVGGTQNGASITLGVGQSATCTINNNDIAPQLTVIKHVINNNGGNKVAGDFTMNVTGSSVSDDSFPGAENPGTTVTLNAGAYSVDENNVAGYAKNLGTDCSGSIAVGEHKTCTITNDDIAPTLTLVKTVVNNNGGNLQVSQVPLFISGSPALSGTPYNVTANVLYTATETQQTGYLASAWGGDCAANGTITLLPGDNKTCTITNDDIAPVLTFIKVVNNNFGGTLGAFDFPLYINGNLVTSGAANTLSANTLYTLTELQQYGYTGGTISGDCATDGTITLLPGQTKTCYITNNDVQPKLTVTKVVINDNGGTKQVSDFPLFVNATGVVSGVQNGFNAGTYTVSETNLPGYTATISGDCNPTTGSVSLAVGDVKSCTITNDDQPGTLIVNKIVINDNGGSSEPEDFSYQINTGAVVGFEADGSNSQTVDSGYYSITEPAVSGYTTTYNNCDRVFVPNGGSATCTITNDDQQASIRVIKSVTNDNGGSSQPNDFNLTLEGNAVLSGIYVPVNPGTYTAAETLLPGYTFSGFSGDCDSNGDITVALGESKTCTLSNDDQQAYITVTKVVTNDDGGDADPNDFNLTLEGNSVLSGAAVPVNPGTYTAGETLLPGYTFEGFTGDCNSSGDVTVALGESKTCTLTNNDQQAYITVVKVVNKDNGGTAAPNDFALTLEGGPVTSSVAVPVNPGTYTAGETLLAGYTFDGFSGDCDSNGDVTVALGQSKTCTLTNSDNAPSLTLVKEVTNDDGGTADSTDWILTAAGYDSNSPDAGTYNLSESGGPTGYNQTSLTCDNSRGQVTSVTLGLGEHVTCTFVNDDIAPTLKLVKNVTKNNGGNETTANWTLYATGDTGFNDTGDSTTFHTVKAGVGYVLSESSVPGYTASSWSCDGGVLNGSTVTLGLDEDVTCQITNDDIAPTLTVIKHVSNDNGGNAVVTDFDIELNDVDLAFGSGNTVGDVTSYTSTPTVLANTSYTLSEIDFAGYNEGTWSCVDTDSKQSVSHPLTLTEGQNVTCEIRNDDIAPQLTLVKNVITDNGGDADPDDFSLTVAGQLVLSGVKNTYASNTPLTLNETQLSGYSFVNITGDAKCPSVLGGTVTLDEGDDITCTVTNDDQTGTLTVTKVTIPSDTQNIFSITATGNGAIQGSTTRDIQDGTPVVYTVDAGTYSVSESVEPGWDETDNTCDDVDVVNGGQSSCTITNTKRGHLIVQKTTIPAEDENVFSITATGTGTITGGGAGSISDASDHDYEVTPGTYSVTETVPGNWDETSNNCDDVVVDAGETKYCEIVNTKRGNVTVIKYNDHDGDGTQDDGDEVMNGWEIWLGTSAQWTGSQVEGQVTFSDVVPGTYTLREQIEEGWAQTNISCESDETTAIDNDNSHPAVVEPGATTTCYIGNFELGRVYGYKYEDRNGNGEWDQDEGPISGWTIYLDSDSTLTNGDGYFEFTDLLAGDYVLTEDETNPDYTRTEPESGLYNITIASGTGYNEESDYLFGNAPLTDIHGYKWDDVNGNGERDCELINDLLLTRRLIRDCNYTEDLLGGWTIFLDENGNEALDEGEESTTTDNDEGSDHFGWYWFNDLFPGEYTICEVQQEGWQQTYPLWEETVCHSITVPNNNQQTENGVTGPEYHFGNQAEPRLRIQKSNDASGNKNPGDTITYTLVVDLTGSSLSSVTVTDVTPDGFTYIAGSWTADLNGSPLVIEEPNYASPGTWDLGDMVDGDVIRLTYKAKISSDQDGGTYNDIAWAEGESKGWGTVLALGHNSEYVDNIFVGTDVTISKISEQTGSVDIEGEVLGASTELPATGANTGWLLLALGLLIAGLFSIFGGKFMRSLLICLVTISSFLFTLAPSTSAVDYPNLSVRVEQPQSPTGDNDWKLSYAVLDRLERTPSVSCYVKKPGSGSFTQFDVTKTSSKTTGDNGSCQVNSSVISNGQGAYEFYVTASSTTGEAESKNSATVTVVYDTEGPDKPVSYSKEHPWACRYTIKFKTAKDDGKTTSVQIFGSTSTSFDTNNSTRVGGINIGSDQEGSFNHDLVGDDCNKTWYYVIRAYDASGNQSAHIGDEVVTIGATTSTTTPALVVTTAAGSVLGKDQSGEDKSSESGEVLGDEEQEETVEGSGLIESVKTAVSNSSNTQKLWWIFAIVAILVIIYVLTRKSKST